VKFKIQLLHFLTGKNFIYPDHVVLRLFGLTT